MLWYKCGSGFVVSISKLKGDNPLPEDYHAWLMKELEDYGNSNAKVVKITMEKDKVFL